MLFQAMSDTTFTSLCEGKQDKLEKKLDTNYGLMSLSSFYQQTFWQYHKRTDILNAPCNMHVRKQCLCSMSYD